MKKTLFTLGLATGLSTQLFAGETLHLKLEPDRTVLLRGSPQEVVVKIDLEAIAHKKTSHRVPLNIAVVIDRSGSMTGAKIEKARQAAMELVDHLAPDDIFSLVAYSDEAQVLVPAQRVEDKAELKRRIACIQANGSTALYSGVKTGARQIEEYISQKRINRVLLLSDGLANVGPSSPRELRHLGHLLSNQGISVTTIGVGDDYNEDLMSGLAEASDANYYYVKDTEMLPQIFARELGELLTVAAREIRIEIVCPDGVRPIGFIGRGEQFQDQKATVKLSQFVLGQDRYLFLRCQVLKDQPEIARVKVSYMDELDGGSERSASGVVSLRFTEDKDMAAGSVNAAVTAEKELIVTAVTKDEALADADAGRLTVAAEKLAKQATALDGQYANAPAAVQQQIRQESKALRDYSDQLQKNQYDAGTRKSMQWESYNARNSNNSK
ncbi:MAG TPA: VWA domain-containing protein [Verrucomicrobiae bacterium]|nr:VWA domain-containing protein [Verrucomicrobiae bacterium]